MTFPRRHLGALWAQESEDETQICVKLATTIVSAFFWQLTWIRRDKKQSTLSTSCHNTLSNIRILLPTYSRKTKHVCHCGCVSEWISSWQSLLCTPEGPFPSEHPTEAQAAGLIWNELPGDPQFLANLQSGCGCGHADQGVLKMVAMCALNLTRTMRL